MQHKRKRDIRQKQQQQQEQQQSAQTKDAESSPPSRWTDFQCDQLDTPILLPASCRVYDIHSHSEAASSTKSSDRSRYNQVASCRAKECGEGSQTSSLKHTNIRPTTEPDDQILCQALQCAGVSEGLLNDWLQTDYSLEPFLASFLSKDNDLIISSSPSISEEGRDVIPTHAESSDSRTTIQDRKDDKSDTPMTTRSSVQRILRPVESHQCISRVRQNCWKTTDGEVSIRLLQHDLTSQCSSSVSGTLGNAPSRDSNLAYSPAKPKRGRRKKKANKHAGKDWRRIIAACEASGVVISRSTKEMSLSRKLNSRVKTTPGSCVRVTRNMTRRGIRTKKLFPNNPSGAMGTPKSANCLMQSLDKLEKCQTNIQVIENEKEGHSTPKTSNKSVISPQAAITKTRKYSSDRLTRNTKQRYNRPKCPNYQCSVKDMPKSSSEISQDNLENCQASNKVKENVRARGNTLMLRQRSSSSLLSKRLARPLRPTRLAHSLRNVSLIRSPLWYSGRNNNNATITKKRLPTFDARLGEPAKRSDNVTLVRTKSASFSDLANRGRKEDLNDPEIVTPRHIDTFKLRDVSIRLVRCDDLNLQCSTAVSTNQIKEKDK